MKSVLLLAVSAMVMSSTAMAQVDVSTRTAVRAAPAVRAIPADRATPTVRGAVPATRAVRAVPATRAVPTERTAADRPVTPDVTGVALVRPLPTEFRDPDGGINWERIRAAIQSGKYPHLLRRLHNAGLLDQDGNPRRRFNAANEETRIDRARVDGADRTARPESDRVATDRSARVRTGE